MENNGDREALPGISLSPEETFQIKRSEVRGAVDDKKFQTFKLSLMSVNLQGGECIVGVEVYCSVLCAIYPTKWVTAIKKF